MNGFWRTIAVAASVAACCTSGFGQTPEQPVVLIIETENAVFYRGDVTDATRLARDPGVTTAGPARAFQYSHFISDIVAVNGKPAKGLVSRRTAALLARVNPQPGQTMADFDGTGPYFCFWDILGPDGTWIGSLMDGGVAPPGRGDAITAGNAGQLQPGLLGHDAWRPAAGAGINLVKVNKATVFDNRLRGNTGGDLSWDGKGENKLEANARETSTPAGACAR